MASCDTSRRNSRWTPVISFRTVSGIGIAKNSRSFSVELSSAIALQFVAQTAGVQALPVSVQ
jgi:hypothetical protein